MKSLLIISLSLLSIVTLSACANNKSGPLSDAELREKYNLSEEEFQENKEAAARMNMSIETHLETMGTEDMDHNMDM